MVYSHCISLRCSNDLILMVMIEHIGLMEIFIESYKMLVTLSDQCRIVNSVLTCEV